MLSPRHGCAARVLWREGGRPGWDCLAEGSTVQSRPRCEPCGSGGALIAAASRVTTSGSVRCEGSAGPAVQGGSMQRCRLCPSSSSRCLRGVGGDSWARQEIGPSRKGCVRMPHCLQLALKVGAGCWGHSLGSLLSLTSPPTHSWCFRPGFCGGQKCGSLSPVDRRF